MWPDIHLTPEEASEVHLVLKGDILMPIHWGTFNLAFHDWFEPPNRLVAAIKEKDIKDLAMKLCKRRFSIGADGLLVLYNSLNADVKMCIFNSDGTEAEMCGNGIRCFAKYCFEKKLFLPNKKMLEVETVAGIKKVMIKEKRGKAEYIIELARKITNEELTKSALLNDDHFEKARKKLIALRGVGKWTVDYVCLRCLKDPTAFPVDDIGLQNAIKQQLGLNDKPTVERILRYAAGWKNWQAYAAFYLWRSLI